MANTRRQQARRVSALTIALVGLVMPVATVVSIATPAEALCCWGNNHGTLLENTDASFHVLGNRDGIYMTELTTSAIGFNTAGPHYGNVRPMGLYFGNGEWVALGWFLGWGGNGVEYTRPSYYTDGNACGSGNCFPWNIDFSTLLPAGPIDNTWSTFQIQERGPSGAKVFQLWVGPGKDVPSNMQNAYTFGSFKVVQGVAGWGTEDVQNTVDSALGYNQVIWSHGLGGASTSPPGHANYSAGYIIGAGADPGCTYTITAQAPGSDTTGGSC